MLSEPNVYPIALIVTAVAAAGFAAACAVLKASLDRADRERRLLAKRHESFAEESSRQIQSFARISASIASSLQREQLLSQILLVLGDYLPGTSIRLLVYHPGGALERIGSNEQQSDAELTKPTDENLFNLIASISGGKRNREWDLFLDEEARKAFAYNFPFIAEEEFKGSLVATANDPFSERTQLFLGDIATLIASAHQNVLTARQKDKISEQFGKSVDPRVRDHLLSAQEPGASRDVSVMFLDIRNFTSRSEELGPELTVAFLNDIFTACDEIIRNHGGFINKFTGDGFMAVFGAPEQTDTHPSDAVLAAIDMSHLVANRDDPVRVGIGIASGTALAGTIGSNRRMEYTVIGDTVNTASRIEGLNKFFGTTILISGSTQERLESERVEGRYFGRFILKGKEKPVEIWGVREASIGDNVCDPGTEECWTHDFSDAVSVYFSGDFVRSLEYFTHLHGLYPKDRAIRWFQERSSNRKSSAGEWDGVERLTEK